MNLLDMILQMAEGSKVTLEIFFVTLLLALPLGMLASLARLSSCRPLSLLMEFYIWLMRGTPLMLQLLFVYFALPMVGKASSGDESITMKHLCSAMQITINNGFGEGLVLDSIILRRSGLSGTTTVNLSGSDPVPDGGSIDSVRISFSGDNIMLFSRENGRMITNGAVKL